jgi:hypothetical protein
MRVSRLVAEVFFGPSELEVDHIDNDPRNNRVENLRYVTRAENCRDRGRVPKGVRRSRSGKFEAFTTLNYRSIHIGTFATEEEAAAAFRAKYEELHGCAPGERILPENHPAHEDNQ